MESNWVWGLSLIALTIAVHTGGIGFISLVMFRIRNLIEAGGLRVHPLLAMLIGMFGAVGLLLSVLHGIEAGLWAVAYWWFGALNSVADAVL